jgi:hypothetical protein
MSSIGSDLSSSFVGSIRCGISSGAILADPEKFKYLILRQ